ncbi:hypothetical protein [Streptomyces melanogenes]|uniref:hypothetical protein n=1 Tax=Streptomyces melanogenes TaxID=67326 RepID=UPI0037AB5CC4
MRLASRSTHISTRIRSASTALAVLAGSVAFAAVGAGTAQASSSSCAQVLGQSQTIMAGGRSIGSFYLAWNYCDPNNKVAYTEVNLWNTNYVNANWHNGLIDVKSSSNYSANTNAPVLNANSWWWDSGFIKVAPNVSNTRLYHGNMNFTAGGHSCSGQTPTWNFSNGSPDNDGMFVHCS